MLKIGQFTHSPITVSVTVLHLTLYTIATHQNQPNVSMSAIEADQCLQ